MFFKNIVCPACGAACDDIQVEFGEEKIEAKNLCKMGNAKFKAINKFPKAQTTPYKGGRKIDTCCLG